MTGIYKVYVFFFMKCHIAGIYTRHIPFHFLEINIHLAYIGQLKSCALPGSRIAIEMQQRTGVGSQECLNVLQNVLQKIYQL
jgi:hypothetical protein